MELMEVIDIDREDDQAVLGALGLPTLLGTREPIDTKREDELKNFERMMREVPGR